MSTEVLQEKEQETTDDPIQSKIDEIERGNAAALESQDVPEGKEAAEAESQDEPEEKAESTETEAEPTFDKTELDALRHMGLKSEIVAKLGDDGKELVRRLVKVRSDTGRLHATVGHMKRQLEQQTQKPAEQEAEIGELDPEEWGDVGKTVNALLKQNKALQQRLESFEQQTEHTTDARVAKEVDGFFNSIDKELYPQFGDGATGELSEFSSEYETRLKVIDKAGILLAGHAQVHGNSEDYVPMTREEALKEALQLTFPNANKKIIDKKVKDRSGSQISRASSRKTYPASLKGKEKAIAAIESWEKENGINW